MRLRSFARPFVALFCLLAADSVAEADENSPAYKLGTLVGYAELCNQFRGTTLDFLLVRKVKKAMGDNADFESAYGEMALYKGNDALGGLNDCHRVSEFMDLLRKRYEN